MGASLAILTAAYAGREKEVNEARNVDRKRRFMEPMPATDREGQQLECSVRQ
jgi:hypothetical protein